MTPKNATQFKDADPYLLNRAGVGACQEGFYESRSKALCASFGGLFFVETMLPFPVIWTRITHLGFGRGKGGGGEERGVTTWVHCAPFNGRCQDLRRVHTRGARVLDSAALRQNGGPVGFSRVPFTAHSHMSLRIPFGRFSGFRSLGSFDGIRNCRDSGLPMVGIGCLPCPFDQPGRFFPELPEVNPKP